MNQKKFYLWGLLVGVIFVFCVLAFQWVGGTYALGTDSLGNEQVAKIKEMTLNRFKLFNNHVHFGEKIYIDLDYSSNDSVTGCSLWLKNTVYGNVLYYTLEDFDTKPYIFLDNDTPSRSAAVPGEYSIEGMTCFFDGFQGGGNYYFSNKPDREGFTYADFGENLVILPNDVNHTYSHFKLYEYSLLDQEVSLGDMVSVFLNTDIHATSTLLSFYNKSTGEALPVYLKGMEKQYFVVPSTATSGEYVLQYIQMKDLEHSYILLNNNGIAELYEDGVLTKNQIEINFEQILKIQDNSSNNDSNNSHTFLFNNEDYNGDIKTNIMDLDDSAIITVIADRQTLIQKGLFEAIKGTQRTLIINYEESEWVFHGKDIQEPKNIDVSLFISDITTKNFKGSFVGNIPEKSKLLTFSNNGELPGKVLIRLKSMELDKVFGEEQLYIYYYAPDEDSLEKVAMEIQKDYGYYEFYIHHNSDYILTTTELKGNYVSKSDKLLELNQSNQSTSDESDNHYKFLWGLGGVIVIIILVVGIVMKKKKS